MTFTATITRSRQLTIPAPLFKKKMFQPGEKVLVTVEDNGIKVTSALGLVQKVAGSVSLPKRYQGLSLREIKEKAKREHLARKYSVYR